MTDQVIPWRLMLQSTSDAIFVIYSQPDIRKMKRQISLIYLIDDCYPYLARLCSIWNYAK